MRIGTGYDVHQLVEGRPLVLGGVQIPFEKGLLGHSDADVLVHAVMDALLGALALGSIGDHFPDSEAAYAGVDSRLLLKEVVALIVSRGYILVNLDSTIICQEPKLKPYIDEMRANIAADLNVEIDAVSVKATTTEKLGFAGKGLGIAAEAVVLLKHG